MIKELTKGENIKGSGKEALLFHIPGHCAGCKRVISILQTKKLEDWNIYTVNSESDEFTELINKYNVATAPTIVTFEDGIQQETIVGLKAFLGKKEIFGD